jgi:PAS domain S-box-containing protein
MDRQTPDNEPEEIRQEALEPAADPMGPERICRETLAASPFGILVHDAGGKILLFNPRLEQITGYAAGEIPDIPTWLRLIYPGEEYREIVLAEARRETPPGAMRVREAMITRRDGRTGLCRFTSERLDSGLRVVYIQPVYEPGATLAESEERYRFLYQSSLLPTLLWIRQSGHFILVSYNDAARNLLGSRLESVLGRPHADIFPSKPEFFECMRRCLSDQKTLEAEFPITTKDERVDKYLKLTFICATPALVTVHVEDLTRLKQAEEEIERREKRFQELVNMLPETVYEMDATGRILFLNPNGLERFGVTPADIERGFYPIELLIPEDRERARQNMARLLAGTYSGPNEYTAVLRDGRRVSQLAHSRPIVRDGRAVGSRGIIVDTSEQKNLAASLRDNEERLRLAVEAAQIGIYTTDLETGYRQWSAEMYAIVGQPPGTLKTDKEAWSIVHAEDRERVLEIHRRALDPKGGGSFYSEHRIVRPDGEVRWIAWRGRTFFRETASGLIPCRRLGTCMDITERKLSEIALKRSENKFSKMFNASPHSLVITTFDEGRYLEANPAESFITGCTREELIGRTVFEVGFYDNPEDGRNIRRLLAKYGTVANYRFRLRRKSGQTRWGLISANIIEFEGEKCLFSTVSDITDLHQTEEALRLSETRLRLATEGATIGWWDWDLRSDSVVCNDVYYTMIGYSPQEMPLSLERWKELVFPADRESIVGVLNRVLVGELPAFRVEYRMRCKDGSWRWIQDIGRVLERDPDGNAARAMGIHIDIHERKLFEEKLFKANQELEERVNQRTASLAELNESLRREISARSTAERDLVARTEELAEINNALRVILRQSREDSEESTRKMASHIRQLAFPHLEKLKRARLTGRQAAYVQLLDEALSQIASQEASSLSELQRTLTASEFQVAGLIRQGQTSKQISEILSLSCRTIESHRKSIRRKLGLQQSKTNLRSHLASIGPKSQPPKFG